MKEGRKRQRDDIRKRREIEGGEEGKREREPRKKEEPPDIKS